MGSGVRARHQEDEEHVGQREPDVVVAKCAGHEEIPPLVKVFYPDSLVGSRIRSGRLNDLSNLSRDT